LRPLEEARAEVLGAVKLLGTEEITLWKAAGRVLGADIIAPESVPPFANSAMDGFAVQGEDVGKPGRTLQIIGDLPAGSAPTVEVGSGEAMRIMTGAPMPVGADTVVKVEDTDAANGTVRVLPIVATGTAVRALGGDVAEGQLVFAQGTMLTPMHIGVLANLGVSNPPVFRRPKVAFMSTGDELMPVDGGRLGPGMIRDSNRPMLRALLQDAGAELMDMGIVPDDEVALRSALDSGSRCDAIVTTGGVSMGDYDVTKLVLADDAGVDFWKIAIQPAKPFAFGHIGASLFFGLPGNPVSALVSFEQFVRPALLSMQGARHVLRPQVGAIAAENLVSDPVKTVFLRVAITGRREGVPIVAESGGQSSNVLTAAADADAFAVVPVGVGTVAAGDPVTIELFRAPASREYQNGK
jgi:molybdopterin molybdotransferase